MTSRIYYSAAVGGTKLQVIESDLERAISILKELGYPINDNQSYQASVSKIIALTEKIPVLKRFKLQRRYTILLISLILLLCLFIGLTFFVFAPSTIQELVTNKWCIIAIDYGGKLHQPNSYGVKLIMSGRCSEQLSFEGGENEGTAYFPGINTYADKANWEAKKDSIIISGSNNLGEIYNGRYRINISGKRLTLISNETVIHGQKSDWSF